MFYVLLIHLYYELYLLSPSVIVVHLQLILHRQDFPLLHLPARYFLLLVVIAQLIITRRILLQVILLQIV